MIFKGTISVLLGEIVSFSLIRLNSNAFTQNYIGGKHTPGEFAMNKVDRLIQRFAYLMRELEPAADYLVRFGATGEVNVSMTKVVSQTVEETRIVPAIEPEPVQEPVSVQVAVDEHDEDTFVRTRHAQRGPKLTREDAKAIKAKIARGCRPCTLAKEYKVTASHIGSIARGRFWRSA